MGVSEQIQDALRQGQTTEQILELLKSKGLSEANARKFIERAQAVAASGSASAPPPAPASGRGLRSPTQVRKPAATEDDEEGDGGTWMMVQGSFFFLLGLLGTVLTYVLARPGGRFVLLYGAIAWGFLAFGVGLLRFLRVRDSRPFPALAVGASSVLPVLIMIGIYINTTRTRSQRKAAAVQLVRDEEKRRGIESTAGAPLDPISAYIVIVKAGGADSKAQREAVWRLGEMGPRARDAVPALLVALKSPSVEVRRGSAEALMKIDGPNPAVVTAVKALFGDVSLDVWSALIGDFARKGDPDAQRVLVSKLEDSYLWSRERACGILGTLRENPGFAAPPIIARLKTEIDWRVRIGCARALGDLGHPSPEARAVLQGLAASNGHADLIKAAKESLAKLETAVR